MTRTDFGGPCRRKVAVNKKFLSAPGLRYVLNASPYGRRRAALRSGAERRFIKGWAKYNDRRWAKSS
jgi:hypothetical protein